MSESLESSGQLDIWAAEIRAIGNTNPLTNFEPNAYGQFDLDKAHPGGLAQFVSSKTTTLSNLFRESLTFSKSLAAARRIYEKGATLRNTVGIETIYLAGGVASLVQDGFDLSLPIVLWPVELRRRTDDFEVAIVGNPIVNPALESAFEVSYGVRVESAKLLGQLGESHDLLPIRVLEYLGEIVGPNANLETKRVLTVANFAVEAIQLANDLSRSDTPLLRILAGLDQAPEATVNEAEPLQVVDADATQLAIVQRAMAGESFAVETLPGCGYTQTVLNLVANLAHAGKRILVVTPRRQTLNELADRLSAIGLGGLAVRTSAVWFDLAAAISRHEKAVDPDLASTLSDRNRAAIEVAEYYSVLVNKNEALGVSVNEILSKLASLSLMPHAPTSSARISKGKLLQLQDKSEALALLAEACELGEFKYGPQDTPWYGAVFNSADEVQDVSDLATKLTASFSELSTAMASFVEKLNLKTPNTFEDWGNYLQLAAGIRLTLDRFVEDVYHRDLAPLIAATGPRTGRSELSGSDRRRLGKLAKEYLRPGMVVSDLNVALTEIQEQRSLWDSFSIVPSTPWVIAGVSDLQVMYQAFAADLRIIQSHLDPSSEAVPLVRMPLSELEQALRAMSEDLLPLRNFAERAAVVAKLRELGLGEVVRDFARLHVQREHLTVELDQVYWQSALEYAVAKDPRILSFTAERIEFLEDQFRDTDSRVVDLGAGVLAAKQGAAWREALSRHQVESVALKEQLRTRQATIQVVEQIAPSIAPVLTSVVLASPYEVPSLLHNNTYDTVLILDAAGTTLAENLAAIRRATQVVAFGDDAIASPFGFEIECNEQPLAATASDRSVFDVVREAFGGHTLRRSWRANGQTLGHLINREFYQNRIQFEATANEYLGQSNFALVKTKNLAAELEKTVALIIEHATKTPEKSLMVGTASLEFANQLRDAITQKQLDNPELEEFFDAHGREKFEIATIAELSHRIADEVIFSLGIQSSPELLEGPYARKFVANLLVSARTSIIVVTSLEEIPHEWPLSKLLNDVFSHAKGEAHVDNEDQSDPMLMDLANRLRRLGARVTLGFGENLPLVISYGNRAGVVIADWMQLDQPVSERLRLHPALLQAMGWQLIRVHSFELFSDPQTLALRIALAVGMPVSKTQAPLFDERSKDDTDIGWNDSNSSNDRRLREDKPPHWG